jgi:hypothetical protein
MDNIIIDKIKKLLALSKSSNENEAILAYQRAQELLIKYNISLDDIQVDIDIKEEIVWTGDELEEWKFTLYSIIAYCNYCQLLLRIFNNKSYNYTLVGKIHNIIIVKEMYQYLINTIEKISNEKIVLLNTHHEKNGLMLTSKACESIKIGIVKGLSNRLLHQKQQMEKNGIKKDYSTEPTTAIIISNLYNQEDEKITQYLKSKYDTLKQVAPTLDNIPQFVAEGEKESKKIRLNKQIKGDTHDKI